MDKRAFIEVDFPVKEVSAESTREKNIRHGHISTLHIWWARRPLAASRATIYAALTPEPKNEKEIAERKKFIAKLCMWDNSNDKGVIRKAREDILKANEGIPPKVLDPFAGGGAIPLEAFRLGCETYASDLNPVAVLLNKVTLEFPQKYGQPRKVKTDNLEGETEINPLLEDVNKWGKWVLDDAWRELSQFYPQDPDGSVPVGYLWARTIRCKNPKCGADIPLLRQTSLVNKSNKKQAFRFVINKDKKPPVIEFEIVSGKDIDFDPSQGTISRANVFCPVCSSGIDANSVRKEAKEEKLGERMIVVVLHKPGQVGKKYRIANKEDIRVFLDAALALSKKDEKLRKAWGISPVPDELITTPSHDVDRPPMYGMDTWGDIFNQRQKLTLLTFCEKIRQIVNSTVANEDDAFNKAARSIIALALDRLADYNSTLTRWHNRGEFIGNTFTRQALSMIWDYFELNPNSGATGDWNSALDWICKVLSHISEMSHLFTRIPKIPKIVQASATHLPHPDNYFDAVITDPPYYDNVGYANLSDFFYVWLKRTIGDLYPALFATPLTPKAEECVQDPNRQKSAGNAKQFYENTLTGAFSEICRVLKEDGIATIVFAHTSTDAWETIINALLNSGLYLSASWPIHTEMKDRIRAKETASLASSIYMVCRKRKEGKTAYFNEIKAGIEKRIHGKLDQFWEEGIGGSDFFISAIGPAVEIFGKYERVEKLSGEQVMAAELLEYVRKVVSEYALSRILDKPQLGGIDVEARFYLLWRWTYNNAKLPFDDARKLSQAVGIELTEYWNKGFIKKEKEFIRVLYANERGSDFLKHTPENMVDVLHQALLLWVKNDRKAISELLSRAGHISNDDFWRLAQAIAEVLPEGDREKQMLQGFLYGKGNYVKASPATPAEQASLFE